MTSLNEIKGQLLVATPTLDDINFKHAVILILEHGDEGTMGVIVNEPINDITIGKIAQELELADETDVQAFVARGNENRVFRGGPVDKGHGFLIHSNDVRHPEHSVEITPEVSRCTAVDLLALTVMGDGPEHYRFLLGYAGWSTGQLASEILENSWLICPLDMLLIFETPPEDMYAHAFARMGIDPDKLVAQPGIA